MTLNHATVCLTVREVVCKHGSHKEELIHSTISCLTSQVGEMLNGYENIDCNIVFRN